MTQFNSPPPIDYSQPSYFPPAGRPLREFMTGLGVGILISAIAWSTFWGMDGQSMMDGQNIQPIVAIFSWGAVAAKLITAIVLMFLPRRRLLGAGLLCSAAIGFLIFFGLCFTAIASA